MSNGRTEHAALSSTPHLGLRRVIWVILFFLLIGCVKLKPTLTYQPLLERSFTSRPQPATLSQTPAETLVQKGFVKIGYIDIQILQTSCRRYLLGGKDIQQVCEPNSDSDPTPWLLRKGGQVGGELVVIEFERSHTETMDMMGIDAFYTKEFSHVTAAVWRKN